MQNQTTMKLLFYFLRSKTRRVYLKYFFKIPFAFFSEENFSNTFIQRKLLFKNQKVSVLPKVDQSFKFSSMMCEEM